MRRQMILQHISSMDRLNLDLRATNITESVYITAPQCEHIEHDYNRKEKIILNDPENTMVYNNTCDRQMVFVILEKVLNGKILMPLY